MEEQKSVKKEVKMEPVVSSNETAQNAEGSLIEELQKWTKEKLIQQVVQMNRQLFNQGNYVERLKGQINEMQYYLSNKRMEYLFKVIDLKDNFKSDFVIKCCDEIQEVLTIPEQMETAGKPKEN